MASLRRSRVATSSSLSLAELGVTGGDGFLPDFHLIAGGGDLR